MAGKKTILKLLGNKIFVTTQSINIFKYHVGKIINVIEQLDSMRVALCIFIQSSPNKDVLFMCCGYGIERFRVVVGLPTVL